MAEISYESPLIFTILLHHVSILERNLKTHIISMEETTIKFENMPAAVAFLIKQVAELNRKLDAMTEASSSNSDQWMDIEQLRNYLPTHPARQTIYGWTSTHQIPFHKKGKRIMFLKPEIDQWLIGEQLKSISDITADAEAFCNRKSH